jgi:hypothetical protein
MLDRGLADLRWLRRLVAEDRYVYLFAKSHQLLDGGGAVCVGRHQQRPLSLLAQMHRQLGDGGRLAGALKPHQHDHRGRGGGDGYFGLPLPAQHGNQLFIDDLDHLLDGGQAPQQLAAHSPLTQLGDEALDDFEVDVGLQQRQPHLLHGKVNVLLGQLALGPKAREHGLQLV